jgi:RNA polymerase sigma-70 factor (ECF subfamily)
MSNEEHLSQIETLWSVVRRAHDAESTLARAAQEEMLERYGGAIHRYLRGALRDDSAADDLYQEFAVRFLRGDFQKAAPERGRFRGFLKSVLFRMVIDYFRSGKVRRSAPLDNMPWEPATGDIDEARELTFNEVWRTEMLDRAWAALNAVEQRTNKPLATVLRTRVDHPELKSTELADVLSEKLGKPISSSNLRVMLHRSRDLFADLLLDAIAQTLDAPSRQDLEQELVDLELLDYCRSALSRRRN